MSTGRLFHTTTAPTRRRIGLLSTFPPELCGLATFTAALGTGLERAGSTVDVVRIADGIHPTAIRPPVVAELVNGVPESVTAAAAALSRCDVAIVQHEYGIYGGPDGDEVLDLLRQLEVPSIVILHTVPLEPTPHQRSVLIDVCDVADRVVVMTQAAMDRLTSSYPVDETRVVTIAHGASVAAPEQFGAGHHAPQPGSDAPQLLTWGLLGPGKGIEHVIDALALLGDLRPRPRFTVAGVTHPKVFARRGDAYRQSLIERALVAGVAGSVTFDDTYRDVGQLMRFVATASVVVLPYDSRDQVTSGVLVDAIAAGRPVIATAFPHAIELLGSGAGIVVPQSDPPALAAAIRSVLTDPGRLAAMGAEARRLAPSVSWSAVAEQYAQLADDLVRTGTRVSI